MRREARTRRWAVAGLAAALGLWACGERGEEPVGTVPPEARLERAREAQRGEPPARVDVAPGADMGELQKLENEQREQYEAIAEDVGVPTWPQGVEVGEGPATGGAGGQPQWRGCAPTLERPGDAAQVVEGQVVEARRGRLVVEEEGGRQVMLATDPSTCIRGGGVSLAPEALRPGEQVRADYVVRQGVAVARLVRAAPGPSR